MRILGLDFGTKRIGVAISDGESSIAHKYGIIQSEDRSSAVKEVLNIIDSEKAEEIVIGRPVGLSGGETGITGAVDEFIEMIRKSSGIPINAVDERFSSKTAEQNVGTEDREEIDKDAARTILQQYMDSK